MPTVELDIGGTPTRVQVSDGYTPDDLDHIAAVLGNQPQTPLARAGQYLTHKGSEFVGALQGVQKDVENVVTGQPYGTGFPGERSGWDTAGDVAQSVSPIVAPELTAAGLGVGTAARAAGADEPTADIANAVTQLGVGGVQAVRGITGAVRGVRAAREATQAAAEAGVTTARAGVQTAKEAAQAAKTAVPEGQRLGTLVPGMRQAAAGARGKLFDPIVGRLTALGRTVEAGTPEGDRLAQALLDAQDEWGDVAGAGEKRVIKDVLGKLKPPTPTPVETGVLDEAGTMMMRTPAAPTAGVTAQELDDALKVLNTSGKGFAARRALVQATQDLAKGTDVEGALTAAGREYHATIKPGQYFAKQIANAGTPGQATARAIQTWNKLAPETQALVDPQGEIAAMVAKAQQAIKGVGTAQGTLRTATAARAATNATSPIGRGIAGLGVGGVVAIPRAIDRFSKGDIRGGMEQLLIGTGIGAAVAVGGKAAITGAAGPLARTGVSLAGLGAGAGVGSGGGGGGDETQPADIGTAGLPATETPPPSPATPSARIQPLPGPYGREIAAVGALAGVPGTVVQSVMQRESSGDPTASAGAARGLMQVKPETFKMLAPQLGKLLGRTPDLNNPFDNLLAGGLYIRQALDKTNGDLGKAAELYTAGLNATRFTPQQQRYGDDIAGSIKPQAFIFHHSGGSSLQGLATTLQQRGLGAEYLMDRDGTIYPFSSAGARQIEPNDRWGGAAPGLTNANSVGMEVVARDNRDVTPQQIAAARRFIAAKYPDTPVFGHGEVNPGHKQRDEGMAIVNAIREDRQGTGG